ncbi:MAG: extracellular solute-binding protein [Bacillota bacterium]
MKKLSFLAIAFLFIFTLSACGGGSEGGQAPTWDDEEEDFAYTEDAEITIGVDSDSMGDALVEKWNEDFPELEGMVDFQNYGSANDDNAGMQGIELQENEAPDIALVIDGEVIGRKGNVYPMDDHFQDIGEEQTQENAFEEINDDDLYYLPAFYDGMAFSWNEQILDDLGIDTTDDNGDGLPESIDTWEKIFDIAEDLNESDYSGDWDDESDRPIIEVPNNDEEYTMNEMFPISLDEAWSGYSSLTAGGWQLFESGELDQPGFDSDDFEEGLDFIKTFSETDMSVDETGSKLDADDMGWRWDSYLQGAYPMSLVGTWQDISQAEEDTGFDFHFSKMPTYDGQELTPFMKTKGFVVNGYTEYPSTAHKVLNWLYSQDTFETMIDNSSYLPALQEDASIFPEIDDENKTEFTAGMENNTLEIIGTLPNNDSVAAMDAFYNIDITEFMKDLWNGETTPADARTDIDEIAQDWLEENNQ